MTRLQVGVALVTCNSMAFLDETLASIEPQLSEARAIHIVDDFSADDTRVALDRWIRRVSAKGLDVDLRPSTSQARDLRTRTAQNFTQAAHALRAMDLIALADHDDLWLPDRLGQQASLLAQQPNVLMLASNGQVAAEHQTLFEVFDVPDDLNDRPCDQALRYVIRNSVATGSASMIRSDLLSQPYGVPPRGWLHDRWWSLVASSRCSLLVDQKPVIQYRISARQQIGLDRGRQDAGGLLRLRRGRLSDLRRLLDVALLRRDASDAAQGELTVLSLSRSLLRNTCE